ncbi:YobA family protein [Cohnella cellulosilytica]|uniref:YobA family protein n=1 Tax=Cohnella cellulosilytica TaxID=986710 RepID=A0ABW2FCA3_9BACL
MRKKSVVLLAFLVVFVLALTACGERPETRQTPGGQAETPNASGEPSENSDFAYEGYIVNLEDGRILVTDTVERDFSDNGGARHFYGAVWFSNAGSGLEIGQRVQVWVDEGIAESYPGQGKASRVEVIEAPKPDGAELTEAEAIRKALEASEPAGMFPPAVKEVEYEGDAGQWKIELAQNGEAQTVVVEVADKP